MTASGFKPFEGIWLASPSGHVACAKVINGELLIPFAHAGEHRLAGHFHECRVVGQELFARFERFMSRESGILFLKVAANFTLKGGWWTEQELSQKVRQDITQAKESLPGMKATVWMLMPKARTPAWAKQYFLEWPTDKTKRC